MRLPPLMSKTQVAHTEKIVGGRRGRKDLSVSPAATLSPLLMCTHLDLGLGGADGGAWA